MPRVSLAELANEDFYDPSPVDTGKPDGAAGGDQSHTPAPGPGAAGRHLVPTTAVALNPLNARPPGEDEEIEGMAETIRAGGILVPIAVCSRSDFLREFPGHEDQIGDADWVATAGNRRLLAARHAGLAEIEIDVRGDPASLFLTILVENGQRRGLPPLHEAEAIKQALDQSDMTVRELAKTIGKSHVYVLQRQALLGLIPELRRALEVGDLRVEQAREFGELSKTEQRAIAKRGKPYRRIPAEPQDGRPRTRSIRVTSPATAAEQLRARFTDEERAELIRLLTEAGG